MVPTNEAFEEVRSTGSKQGFGDGVQSPEYSIEKCWVEGILRTDVPSEEMRTRTHKSAAGDTYSRGTSKTGITIANRRKACYPKEGDSPQADEARLGRTRMYRDVTRTCWRKGGVLMGHTRPVSQMIG